MLLIIGAVYSVTQFRDAVSQPVFFPALDDLNPGEVGSRVRLSSCADLPALFHMHASRTYARVPDQVTYRRVRGARRRHRRRRARSSLPQRNRYAFFRLFLECLHYVV